MTRPPAAFEATPPSSGASLLLGAAASARPARPLLAWTLRLVVVVLVLAVLLWLRDLLRGDPTQPHDRAQRIALLSAPRPPPKPPEPPPEPPRELEAGAEVPPPSAPPSPSAAPAAADALGVDADGQGAGDGFGLLGRRGGRDITTIGGPGGSGAGSGPTDAQRYAYYAGLVLQRLRRELSSDRRLREHSYIAVVHLWVDPRGRIVRSEIEPGTGRIATDAALREAFGRALALPEPPGDLPQPIRLRITSRELVADAR
jgi:periplasmic protein TonB